MKNNSKKKQAGFTLVEILLYLALSVVMVALVGGIGVNVLQSSLNSRAEEKLQYNNQFVTEKLFRLISEAEAVQTPEPTTASSTLSLIMVDPEKNPTIIDVVAGRLRLQEGLAEPVFLSGSDIIVTEAEFSNVTYVGGIGTIRVVLGLGLHAANDETTVLASTTLSTTINLKYP